MTKVLRNSATLLLSMALLLLVGGSAAAQSGENSRYRQFRDTAAASISNPSSGNVRLFFDSTGFYWKNSAGVATAVGGGGLTGLTEGLIPQIGPTNTLVNSKMTTSGTNSGTWTLYDDTAIVGLTRLVLKAGAGQGTDPLMALSTPTGIAYAYLTLGTPTATWQITTPESGGDLYFFANSLYRFRSHMSTGNFGIYPAGQYTFTSDGSTANVGISNPSSGILKVTDGSTGSGGIGISDTATNTVTDALILRHETSDAGFGQDGFGTGLLFQAENSVGTMHDAASIDAVFVDSADGSEDAKLDFNVMNAGTQALAATLDADSGNPRLTLTGFGIVKSTGNMLVVAQDTIYFSAGTANVWQMNQSGGAFAPSADNTYDIGTSAAKVKDSYLGTSIQGTRTQAISDNAAAATFVTVAAATSNTVVGGRIFYTITAIDAGTGSHVKTGTYSFGLNNVGGTVTGTGTDVLEHSAASAGGGTLAPTFSINISGTNAQFQLVLDTSLDAAAETLKIEYRVQIDSGTATVTPAT